VCFADKYQSMNRTTYRLHSIAGTPAHELAILGSSALPFDDELLLSLLELRIVDAHPVLDRDAERALCRGKPNIRVTSRHLSR